MLKGKAAFPLRAWNWAVREAFPWEVLFKLSSEDAFVHTQSPSHTGLCDPMDCSPQCPWGSPGKSTGVGGHFLLQGIFPTQGWNPSLLHWQALKVKVKLFTSDGDLNSCGWYSNPAKTHSTWFQDLMKLRFFFFFLKLRFLMSHVRKNSVRDKVIGKKWIYLERNTLHRKCGPSQRVSLALPKFGVVSYYGLGNFIG